MIRQMTARLTMIALIAGFACTTGVAHAQSRLGSSALMKQDMFNVTAKAPDINSIPVLSNIVKSGAKLYYLGERSGLFGWFIVKGGQIQMIYVTADRQTAMIGAMFSAAGENITGPQITALAARDKTVQQMLNGAGKTQNDVTAAGSVPGGIASVPSDPTVSNMIANTSPAVTLSPGDRLYQDMEAAAGVTLGRGDGPEIMIIVAPKCPNCKKTWKELRDSVKSGRVRVRLIPVYNSLGGEEANMSAQLLLAKDPFDAWDKHVNGDPAALTGTPDEIALKAVTANLNLVSKWNIKGYPYLVYRGKDGKVKIVQGRPERMPAVLLDLIR